MKPARDLLRESPFFETFPLDDIDALAAHAAIRDIRAGEVILRENEPAEALFLIVSGKVRLSFESSEGPLKPATPGDDNVHIRTLTEPGRVIGWSALVEPYHYRVTATAVADTRLLVFERQWLERRAEENPEFGVELMMRILWVLGNRLRETRVRLVASRYEKEALAIRAFSSRARRNSASNHRCTSCPSIWKADSPFPMPFTHSSSCESVAILSRRVSRECVSKFSRMSAGKSEFIVSFSRSTQR